jgi:DnaK suppressor protein
VVLERVVIDVFFKMMGIGASKSLQSRADSQSVNQQKSGKSLPDSNGKLSPNKAQAATARRQEVKAQAKKPKAVNKTAAKPASQPVAKSSVKSGKANAKAAVKPVAKPTAKAKPVAKKSANKHATKPTAKPAAKTTSKSPAKPATKVLPKKSSVKATPKLISKPTAKPAAKPVTKPVAKAPVKTSTPKTLVKTPFKQAKPVKATLASKGSNADASKPVSAQPASAKLVPAKSMPSAASAVKPAAVTKPAAAPSMPPKTTKAGSRVVPSYAPSAANMTPHGGNTAAKASFIMSAPVLAPPPQYIVKKDPKLAGNWKSKSAEQLSDAEVIAMPDSEYMNAKQLAFFRLKLVALKNGILSNAGETTEHLREDTSVVPDPADRATIEEEHALELRTRDRERKLLKKIEQSIASIDAEEYGYCDETGEPIGVARLIARPTATLSLEAQQRRELKQKMFGD